MSLPHVVCLMPTRGREHMLPVALHTFLTQDYEGEATLIILDDSDTPWKPCCRSRPGRDVVYLWEDPKICGVHNCATKRNRIMHLALTDAPLFDTMMFALWDDDDLYGTCRLTKQVGALLANPSAEVCVLMPWVLYDVDRHLAAMNSRYEADGTSVFTLAHWNRGPWDEAVEGFSGPKRLTQQLAEAPDTIVRTDGRDAYVVVRHGSNSTPEPGASYQSGPWKVAPPYSADELRAWLRTAAACPAPR